MAGKTQLQDSATPGRRFGTFSGRTPSSGHGVGKICQLALSATPTRRYGTFAGKFNGGGAGGGGAYYIFGESIIQSC